MVYKENKGQWDKAALYATQLQSGAVFLSRDSITFLLADTGDMNRVRNGHHPWMFKANIDMNVHLHAFRQIFANANVNAKISGSDKLTEYYNYYLGNDPTKWASRVSGFYNITYENLYDNINLDINSENVNLKYDFVVKKGGDPGQIKMNYEGVYAMQMVKGNLIFKTSIGDVTDLAPYAYQWEDGHKKEVKCSFVLKGESVWFDLPDGYDKTNDLIIDPTLIFSTFSGSTADNFGYSATYDSKGNAYAAGTVFQYTGSYPVTTGAFQTTWAGGIGFGAVNSYDGTGTDIAVTKYDSLGKTRIYSTYLGGDHDELPHSVIVNSNNELFILGTTGSDNFPTTPTAFSTSFHGGYDMGVFDGIGVHYATGSDIFITRFKDDGTALLASTYVGGSNNDGLTYPEYQGLNYNYADDVRGEIALDANNNVYVASCSRSSDFPVTAGAYQTTLTDSSDAVVFKMDANLSQMIWSTYIGGNGEDAAYSIDLDPNGDIYIAGGTISTNFPVTPGVVQNTNHGGRADGFVAHLSKNGNVLMQSSYWGSAEYDQAYFVRVNNVGDVYLFGQTEATDSTFIYNAIYNKPHAGQFITKMTPALDSIIWSTTFGTGKGTPDISPTAFLVDVCNKVYVSGWGSNFFTFYHIQGAPPLTTGGLEVTPNAVQLTTDSNDFYIMVMADDASSLYYATYFGSPNDEDHVDGGTSRFDRKGVIFESACAGCNGLSTFPTTPGVVSNTNNSANCNNAVFKLDLQIPFILADFQQPSPVCDTTTYQFINLSKIVDSVTTVVHWNFGDGSSSSLFSPTHTYTSGGTFTVTLTLQDSTSCNGADSVSKTFLIYVNDSTNTLPTKTVCAGAKIQIGMPSTYDTTTHFQWFPSAGLSDTTITNPYVSPSANTEYELVVTNGNCHHIFLQTVKVEYDSLLVKGNNILCPYDTIQLFVTDTGHYALTYTWSPSIDILNGALHSDSPMVKPPSNTTFYVSALDSNGCSYRDSVNVNVVSSLQYVLATATPDTIKYGDTTQLNTIYTQAASLYWNPDSSLFDTTIANPLADPRTVTTYTVHVTDNSGCKIEKQVTVYIEKTPCKSSNLFVPNAFSPNNDGKNDILYVRGNLIQTMYFAIYDRWGQKMFETRDPNTGWDGTFKGKKLDPAVFGWYIEGTCEVGEKFFKKGNVTLLR